MCIIHAIERSLYLENIIKILYDIQYMFSVSIYINLHIALC